MICLRHTGGQASRSRLLLYYPLTTPDKHVVRRRDQRGEARRPGSSSSPACAQHRHHRLSAAKSGAGFSCPDLGTSLCQLMSAARTLHFRGGSDAILSSETRSIMITKRIVNDALCAKTSHPSQVVWSPESASFNGRGCANSNDHTSTMCEHGGRWVGAVFER